MRDVIPPPKPGDPPTMYVLEGADLFDYLKVAGLFAIGFIVLGVMIYVLGVTIWLLLRDAL